MAAPITTKRFWTEPKGKRHTAVVAAAGQIEQSILPWLSKFSKYERLYCGVKTDGMVGVGRVLALGQGATSSKKLPPVIYNIIKSIIDTKRAKITGTDIRPFAITNGGDWAKKRRAKKLTKFIDGLFYETEMRVKGPEFYRHSRVLGTAAFKIFETNGRPTVELTDICELRVDPEDAMYGRPRMMIQVKPVHRDVLREEYDGKDGRPKPVNAEAITGADRVGVKNGKTSIADRVNVYEAWHLPSGPSAKDGLHVICTSAGTLWEEPWEDDDFPFVFLRADNRLWGFWGVGDAEDLEGLQYQVDKTNKTIQLSTHLCSVPRYYARRGSNIDKGHLTNDVGVIVEGDAPEPPVAMEAPPVPFDLYKTRDADIASAYQTKGVSPQAAGSQVPAGITGSGEAQRVYADTQTERFNVEAKEYEQSFIRVAKKLIRLARRIHDRDGEFSVKIPGRKFMESIDWKSVDLKDDEFDLQILPTSNMPKTLSGRIAAIQELIQGGLIKDPLIEGRRLLDFPDLEDDNNITFATWDYADDAISRILDGKKREPIDPFADYQLCVMLGRAHWLRAKVDGAPQKILSELQLWMEEAGAKQMAANQPPPGAMPGPANQPPGGPGMGRPAAAPVSNLIPTNGGPPAAA